MDDLMNCLNGEVKKSIKTVGTKDFFYTTELKVLKRDFGNPLVKSYLKLRKLFDQKQINIKDELGLCSLN